MADKLERIIGNASLKKYFDSPYMGAYSIGEPGDPVLTIKEVLYGKLTLDGGRKENHIVLTFHERTVPGMAEVKPLILNATNQKSLERLYGKGADVLRDKQIQLYVDPAVKAIGGGTTEGIRIRPFVPRKKQPTQINCENCGETVTATAKMTAAQVAAYAKSKFGQALCVKCATAANEQKKEEATPNEPEKEGANEQPADSN